MGSVSNEVRDARRATGAGGEELAARFLERQGWSVVARNWRCRGGELDLIATDPDGVLVFCEVKTRRGLGYGDPLEAITYDKVRRLRALAAEYLRSQDRPAARVRLDAVGVMLRRDGSGAVTHVRGIDA